MRALLTNSKLLELESAWNSSKSLDAEVFTFEQVTIIEEIKAL